MDRHPRIMSFLLAVVCIGLLLLLGFFLVLNHRNQASETDRLKALAASAEQEEQTDTGQSPAEASQDQEETENTEAEQKAGEGTSVKENSEDPAVKVQTEAAGISCWGDEFFSQEDAQYSYKNVLQQLLTDNGYELQVADKTLAGASTLSLMKIAGVSQTDLDQYIAEHTEAAAGVEIPITETGIRDLTAEQTDRSDADYIPVIFMGYYGGWNYDPNELAEQEQKILDTFGANKNNYVIVGLAPADGSVDQATYDSTMKEKWGEHYISAAEVTTVPVASQQGQSEIAQAVFQKLEELGYIKK